MPVDRIHWADLPLSTRRAAEAQTGPILRTETATAGANSAIAATVYTTDTVLFVKGVPMIGGAATQAPPVSSISPATRCPHTTCSSPTALT